MSETGDPVPMAAAASPTAKDERETPGDQPLLPPWLRPFTVAALGGALYGYDVGAVSSALRVLGGASKPLGALSSLELGFVASGSLVGAAVASAVLIGVDDAKFGRRAELITAAGLYIAGTGVQALAPNFPMLLVGRGLYGLGIGVAMHVAPVYIAETSPPELRGRLVSLKELALVGGMVGGYLTGPLFCSCDVWRNSFAWALALAAPMAVLAIMATESPRWLALQGRLEEAVEALMVVQGLDEATARRQVAEMMALCEAVPPSPGLLATLRQLGATPANRRALVIGVGLMVLQQLTGQPSVLYYANRIFERVGLGFQAAVGVAIFKVLMTLVSVLLVEDPRCGRRPLLLTGTSVMAVSLLGLTTLFAVAGPTASAPVTIACIVVYVGGYQIGFGPISWLILSEVFPLEIRSTAVSIGVLANFSSNVLVTLLFDLERMRLGEAFIFVQFLLIAFLAVLFEALLVPETQGLSLEQIQTQLVDLD